MAISPLWPKPPRWPIQPGAVDPNQRWVWHTRPRFILPLWEHASAGAAQRYVRLAQTRRTARTWQFNAGATAMLTFGAALAMAQDTSRTRPRSDRRLPISKEAAGEVVREIVRTDTVMIYRTDTVQLTRRDTVRITRTRIDTVIPRLPKYPYPAGFYGGAIATQFLDETPKCPVILHFGKKDQHITPDHWEKIRERHPDVPLYLYDADHGFFSPDRPPSIFDPDCARLARLRTLQLFQQAANPRSHADADLGV